jgi:hypothetical protein
MTKAEVLRKIARAEFQLGLTESHEAMLRKRAEACLADAAAKHREALRLQGELAALRLAWAQQS